jgi:hypothetical protein
MNRRKFHLRATGVFLLPLSAELHAQQSAWVSDGLFPMTSWPAATLNQFKSNWPIAGGSQPSSLVSLQVPGVALPGVIDLRLQFEGDVPVAVAIFQTTMSRTNTENKFQGSEAPSIAMRVSAKSVPDWTFNLKLQESTRWLAIVATANTLYQAEAITRVGSKQSPKF